MGDAPYPMSVRGASASRVKSGCDRVMPIIVGTITVNVGSYSLIARITAPGSNIGTVTMWPPTAGIDVIVSVEAAWNIGVWRRKVASRP